MSKRAPRIGKPRGRPWRRASTQHSWPSSSTYEERRDIRLAMLRAAVETQSDAAALVQVVREYQQSGRPLPAWVPLALETWLTDFVNLAAKKHAGVWTRWARKWRALFLDTVVAGHLEGGREVYGLTWTEAADEAADWFSGTPARGGKDAMLAAYKRDRKRGPKRPLTHWECFVDGQRQLSSRPYRQNSWWSLNAHRQGHGRGEWLSRPELIFKPTSHARGMLGRKRA